MLGWGEERVAPTGRPPAAESTALWPRAQGLLSTAAAATAHQHVALGVLHVGLQVGGRVAL